MNILMLSDVYFPRINGVSTSIQAFIRSLIELGHTVTLIAPRYPTHHEATFEIIRIPSKRLLFDPEDRLMSLKAIKRLTPMLEGKRFDLVHIQTPFVAHYAGLFLARRLCLKKLTTYHTYFEAYLEAYLPRMPALWLKSVARAWSRRQCNQTDGVVSPSYRMLQKLREYGVERKAAVIPTGLPPESFRVPQDNNFRSHHKIPEDAFLLLYVGRVAFEKNIEFLIAMFDRVWSEVDKAMLLIAGEGPALASLTRQVKQGRHKDRIRFSGYLDRTTQLQACYAASDVFVFASQTETQGLVLLEAMACGLPVVSTASMGILDVLKDGEGCLVAPLQIDAFARRVVSLHDNQPRCRELSKRAIAYASKWKSKSKARELLAFYRQTIALDHPEAVPGQGIHRPTHPADVEVADD